MSKEFVDVLKELFPPVSNATKESLKKLITQHIKDPSFIFESSIPQPIRQGDILTNIPFQTLHEGDEYWSARLFGMLISTTCDFEHEKTVLFAPGYTIEVFKECFGDNPDKLKDLRNNAIYDKFYLPAYLGVSELVIDFNGINSFSVNYIKEIISKETSQRVSSLAQNGYYYLLCKLTVHFFRPEAKEILRSDIIS